MQKALKNFLTIISTVIDSKTNSKILFNMIKILNCHWIISKGATFQWVFPQSRFFMLYTEKKFPPFKPVNQLIFSDTLFHFNMSDWLHRFFFSWCFIFQLMMQVYCYSHYLSNHQRCEKTWFTLVGIFSPSLCFYSTW